MTALLLAFVLSQQPQTPNLNVAPIDGRQNGTRLSKWRQWAIDCRTNMTCTADGGVLTISSSGGGGGGGGGTPVDGGYVVWTSVGSTNERVLTAGTNVTLDTSTPGQLIVNASGGGGGAGNFAEVDIDFGAGDELVTVVVTGQTWVSGTSRIVCSPTMLATSTRLEGEEDAVAEGLTLAVHSRVAGVGFSITAAPRQGYAYGVFKVHCTGG